MVTENYFPYLSVNYSISVCANVPSERLGEGVVWGIEVGGG